MKITQRLTPLPDVGSPDKQALMDKALKQSNVSFGETLNQAIADVNKLQSEASKAVQQMVAGEAIDLHEVMIAVQKAKTSFELLMEVRNKALETYREIMRTQV